MNKACLATCLLAVLLPAKVWAADAPRCSDASVEKALPSLIVGASLGKAYGVRDFGYVGSDVTWNDVHYKFTIDKAQVGGIVDFKFDAQRERRADAAIGKRYCTANVNGAINPSGLRAAIKVGTMGRRNEVQDRVLTPEEIAEATQDVEKKLVRFIRWNNPLNYSVQTLEKGGALVTLNE